MGAVQSTTETVRGIADDMITVVNGGTRVAETVSAATTELQKTIGDLGRDVAAFASRAA